MLVLLASAYEWNATMICRRFARHVIDCPDARARPTTGTRIPTRIRIIAITTISSMRVNPARTAPPPPSADLRRGFPGLLINTAAPFRPQYTQPVPRRPALGSTPDYSPRPLRQGKAGPRLAN